MNYLPRKLLAMVALGLASSLAHAGGVNWSIGINLPPVATVISNAPVYVEDRYYAAAPYYAPPPVAYRPAPIYYAPAPTVVYLPQPRHVGPPAYYVERRWAPPRHWKHRGRDEDDRGRGGHGRHGNRD